MTSIGYTASDKVLGLFSASSVLQYRVEQGALINVFTRDVDSSNGRSGKAEFTDAADLGIPLR